MKNVEVINALNAMNAFVEKQRNAGKSLLSVKGQFALKKNNKILMDAYKPYEETLTELDKDADDYDSKVKELLECEAEGINLAKLSQEDFFDGATIDDIILLDFMTEE